MLMYFHFYACQVQFRLIAIRVSAYWVIFNGLFSFCFQKNNQEHYNSVKWFASRSGLTERQSRSGSISFVKVISRRQKSPQARKKSMSYIVRATNAQNSLTVHLRSLNSIDFFSFCKVYSMTKLHPNEFWMSIPLLQMPKTSFVHFNNDALCGF